MCGISGIISRSSLSEQARMAGRVLRHRGPDADGHWEGQVNGRHVVLHHNRLSIIDLAEHSNQPFWSEDGRFALIYNGEIYNYLELRQELESQGTTFRTQSDTEVLLKLLTSLPLETALTKLNGMFAIALLDTKTGAIKFARDRFGQKPLYVHQDDNAFYFGSEIKFILTASGKRFRPNLGAVSRYLKQFLLNSVPNETFFDGISPLPPGSYVEANVSDLKWEPRTYYALSTQESELSFDEAVAETRRLLEDSVRIHLRSDVKVGMLLSGGLDSSAMAAAAKRVSKGELAFLSVVSNDPRFDESQHIRRVVNHLGVETHEIDTTKDLATLSEELCAATYQNDEPLLSLGTLAHHRMMKRARELGITVLLTGQGADEVFCGYKKYFAFRMQDLLRRGKFLSATGLAGSFLRTGALINEIHWGEVNRYFKIRGDDVLTPRLRDFQQPELGLGSGTIRCRQIMDLTSTSVPALLHYEDRMGMACAREIRVPFLDHRIVEFGLSLPEEFKIGSGWSKRVLREAAKDWLPPEIVWRKDKRGFTVPQEDWLKNELRPQVEAMLSGSSPIFDFGFIDREALRANYAAFVAGSSTLSYKDIFAPFALDTWLRVYADSLEVA